ncbi:tripartite tricarboxylate transporter substrate binding protein [Alcaligenaceae bacterium]|nr:tripartite tricarboxylate transporter substrate binding protein [Alcaligenaceae bacterium]
MKIYKRISMFVGGCLVALAGSAHGAYPERAITFIVPFPPGGSTDTPSRIIAPKLAEILGTSIIVDNRSGASGQIGVNAAARSAPDGYTIVLSASATHTLPEVVGKKIPYDPIKDFRSIGTFVKFPLAVVGSTALPVGNVKELVPYLRENEHKLSMGVASMGSVAHFSAESFLASVKAKPVLAHYAGDSAILTDLMGENIQLGVFAGSSAAPLVNSGKVKGLLVAGSERYDLMPDVPTAAEAGMPGALLEVWYGISVPAGTPDEIVEKLNDALKQTLEDPRIVEQLKDRGFAANYSSSDHLDQVMKDEPEMWRKLISDNNIKLAPQ